MYRKVVRRKPDGTNYNVTTDPISGSEDLAHHLLTPPHPIMTAEPCVATVRPHEVSTAGGVHVRIDGTNLCTGAEGEVVRVTLHNKVQPIEHFSTTNISFMTTELNIGGLSNVTVQSNMGSFSFPLEVQSMLITDIINSQGISLTNSNAQLMVKPKDLITILGVNFGNDPKTLSIFLGKFKCGNLRMLANHTKLEVEVPPGYGEQQLYIHREHHRKETVGYEQHLKFVPINIFSASLSQGLNLRISGGPFPQLPTSVYIGDSSNGFPVQVRENELTTTISGTGQNLQLRVVVDGVHEVVVPPSVTITFPEVQRNSRKVVRSVFESALLKDHKRQRRR